MFYLSLTFLALVAVLIVIWIYVAPDVDSHDLELLAEGVVPTAVELSAEEQAFQARAQVWGVWVAWLLLALWPLFILEQLVYAVLASSWQQFRRDHPYAWIVCCVPPLRLCARDRTGAGAIWFPGIGWQQPTLSFYRLLERRTSVPMMGVALLILPILGLQLKFGDDIVNYPTLRIALFIGTGVIWFAFATEFIVLASVTDKKLKYCKKHWMDIVIIALPLVSFLRSLHLFKAAKFMKMGKLQQLSRLIRVYRLRGVVMRAFRALLVLDLLQRLLRVSPEKRLAKLEADYAEKTLELELLREEIEQLRLRNEKRGAADTLPNPPAPS